MEWDIATQALDCEETDNENQKQISSRVPVAYLKVCFSDTNNEEYSLYQGRTIIGRGEGCDIQIKSTFLSREHVSIDITDDVCLIHDMKSSNKTKRNGTLLIPDVRYELCDNDSVHFGALRCSFHKVDLTETTTNKGILDTEATLEPDDATDLESDVSDDLLAGNKSDLIPDQSQFLAPSQNAMRIVGEPDDPTLPISLATLPVDYKGDVGLTAPVDDDVTQTAGDDSANDATMPIASSTVLLSNDITHKVETTSGDDTIRVCYDTVTMDVADSGVANANHLKGFGEHSKISTKIEADQTNTSARNTVISMVLSTPDPPVRSSSPARRSVALVCESDSSSVINTTVGEGLDGSRYVPASDTEEEEEEDNEEEKTMWSKDGRVSNSLIVSSPDDAKQDRKDSSLNLDDPECSEKLRKSTVFAPGFGGRLCSIIGESKTVFKQDEDAFEVIESSQPDEILIYDEPTQLINLECSGVGRTSLNSTLLNADTQALLMAPTQSLNSAVLSDSHLLQMETQVIGNVATQDCSKYNSSINEDYLNAQTQVIGGFTLAQSTSNTSSNSSEPYTKPKNSQDLIQNYSEDTDDLTQPCGSNSKFTNSEQFSDSDALTQPLRQTTSKQVFLKRNSRTDNLSQSCKKTIILTRENSESDALTQPCRQQVPVELSESDLLTQPYRQQGAVKPSMFRELSESDLLTQPCRQQSLFREPSESDALTQPCKEQAAFATVPDSEDFVESTQEMTKFNENDILETIPESEGFMNFEQQAAIKPSPPDPIDEENEICPDSQVMDELTAVELKGATSIFATDLPLKSRPQQKERIKKESPGSKRLKKINKLFAVTLGEEDTDMESFTQPARASPSKISRLAMKLEKKTADNEQSDMDTEVCTQRAETSPNKVPKMTRHLYVKEKSLSSSLADFVMDVGKVKRTTKAAPSSSNDKPAKIASNENRKRVNKTDDHAVKSEEGGSTTGVRETKNKTQKSNSKLKASDPPKNEEIEKGRPKLVLRSTKVEAQENVFETPPPEDVTVKAEVSSSTTTASSGLDMKTSSKPAHSTDAAAEAPKQVVASPTLKTSTRQNNLPETISEEMPTSYDLMSPDDNIPAVKAVSNRGRKKTSSVAAVNSAEVTSEKTEIVVPKATLGRPKKKVVEALVHEEPVAKAKTEPETENTSKRGKGRTAATKLVVDQETASTLANTKEGASKRGPKAPTKKPVKSQNGRRRIPSDSCTAPDSDLSVCSSGRFREPKKYKIMFTGLDEKRFIKPVKDLGGDVVESPHCATHLVTDQVRRTVKFLCCLARGIPIVVPTWINECRKLGSFIDPASFLVTGHQSDFGMVLCHSLQLARRHRVFSEWTLLATPGTKPDPDQLREMVQIAGADFIQVFPYQTTRLDKIALVTCSADLTSNHPLVVEARDRQVPRVSVEFILSSLMQQTIHIDSHILEGNSSSSTESVGKAAVKSSPSVQKTKKVDGRKRKASVLSDTEPTTSNPRKRINQSETAEYSIIPVVVKLDEKERKTRPRGRKRTLSFHSTNSETSTSNSPQIDNSLEDKSAKPRKAAPTSSPKRKGKVSVLSTEESTSISDNSVVSKKNTMKQKKGTTAKPVRKPRPTCKVTDASDTNESCSPEHVRRSRRNTRRR